MFAVLRGVAIVGLIAVWSPTREAERARRHASAVVSALRDRLDPERLRDLPRAWEAAEQGRAALPPPLARSLEEAARLAAARTARPVGGAEALSR